MKIQPVTPDHHAKLYALLRDAFPRSHYEAALVQQLHAHGKPLHEWVALHTGRVIGYLAFSRAFHGDAVCGLHLAPMAVAPEFQKQGVGSELLRFALRQAAISSQPLFVLGAPDYYRRFGFTPCAAPVCPYDKHNAHFLSLRNPGGESYTIGYEAEFKSAAAAPRPPAKKRR